MFQHKLGLGPELVSTQTGIEGGVGFNTLGLRDGGVGFNTLWDRGRS